MQTQIVSINIREKRTSKVPLELPAKPTSPLQLKKPYEMARPKPATTLTRSGTALIRKNSPTCKHHECLNNNKSTDKQSSTRAPCPCPYNYAQTKSHEGSLSLSQPPENTNSQSPCHNKTARPKPAAQTNKAP